MSVILMSYFKKEVFAKIQSDNLGQKQVLFHVCSDLCIDLKMCKSE